MWVSAGAWDHVESVVRELWPRDQKPLRVLPKHKYSGWSGYKGILDGSTLQWIHRVEEPTVCPNCGESFEAQEIVDGLCPACVKLALAMEVLQ